MEDQHSLPTLSSIPLGLMFWPAIVCWFWTEDEMLRVKCWMKADQNCGASWADSVGTTVDAFRKDRPIPGFKTRSQVVAVPT